MNVEGLFAGAGMPPIEPSADAREHALACWQMYTGYLSVGFTPEQASYLLGQALNGGAAGHAIAQAMKDGD